MYSFSFCIPVHNRTNDLKQVIPKLLESLKNHIVELVIVNYNSKDDLHEYIGSLFYQPLPVGMSLKYRKYTGKNYYHMAHARNLSIQLASNEYIVITSADIYFSNEYLDYVCKKLDLGFDIVRDSKYKGVVVCKKDILTSIGGFDERFEFYSPEDRDLENRLLRKGCKLGIIPNNLVNVIPTPDKEKIKNYRIEISKAEMGRRMHKILDENDLNNVIEVNKEKEWGSWQS